MASFVSLVLRLPNSFFWADRRLSLCRLGPPPSWERGAVFSSLFSHLSSFLDQLYEEKNVDTHTRIQYYFTPIQISLVPSSSITHESGSAQQLGLGHLDVLHVGLDPARGQILTNKHERESESGDKTVSTTTRHTTTRPQTNAHRHAPTDSRLDSTHQALPPNQPPIMHRQAGTHRPSSRSCSCKSRSTASAYAPRFPRSPSVTCSRSTSCCGVLCVCFGYTVGYENEKVG